MKKVCLALALAMILCAFVIPSYAADKKLEITDGTIHFPEKDLPVVELSKIKLGFPPDCPQELLATKGKIFRGELTKSGRSGRSAAASYTNITYIIPVSYNSDTKEMAVYIVQEKGYGKEYESKSSQGWLKGPFDAQNGSLLKWVMGPGSTIMTQDFRLTFQKDGKLRVVKSDGFAAEYTPVGNLPEESVKSDTPS
jgi:hypothetical protein